MKLQDQVCTPEQGKRLNKLGVTGESFFCWVYPENKNMISSSKGVHERGWAKQIINENEGDEFDHVMAPAFTVAELAVMLPDYYPSWRFKVNESSDDCKWIATIICGPKPPGIDDIHTAHEFDRFGKTQAEALATLLIALLETKVITADEVNKRLIC